MGTRNDDISLILAKAKKQGFLPDVHDNEVELLSVEASKMFGPDSSFSLSSGLSPVSFHIPKSVSWISTMQTGHGFTVENATIVDDIVNPALGSQSVQMTVNSPGASAQITKTGLTINTAGKHIIVWARISNFGEQLAATSITGNTVGAIELLIGTAGFGAFYTLRTWIDGASIKPAINGEWFPLRFDWAAYSTITSGAPTRDGLTDIRLRFISSANVSAQNNLVVNIGGIGTVPAETVKYPNGVVSFTFDDAYAEHYTEAKRYLDTYGFAGTAYVITEHFEKAGRLTFKQATDMQNISGWEISGHAMTQSSHDNRLSSLDLDRLEGELFAHKAWLRSKGFQGETYAYPGGVYNTSIIEATKRYFSAAVTTSAQPVHNHPERLDSYFLTRYDASVTGVVGAVKARMDEAKANNSWLILTHHQIKQAIGLTPAEFQEIVDYANTIGIAVKTVQQVIRGT